MNSFIRQYINFKINNLQIDELMDFAREYEIPITKAQAYKVIKILRREKVDIGNDIQRERLMRQIVKEAGKEIQMVMQKLLNKYK